MEQVVILEPGKIALQQAKEPEAKEDQVCIRVNASGLCGTDIHIYHGGFAPGYPVVPGHEFAGEVVAVGPECRRIQIGMRVAVEPNVPCNNCKYCLRGMHHYCLNMEVPGVNQAGGMAEYTLVRERGVFDIGELDYRAGAFVEPVSCVLHSQDRAHLGQGDQVLILGAGPIGLLHGIAAKQCGASRIDFLEIDVGRRQKAQPYTLQGDCYQSLSEVSQAYNLVIDATGLSNLLGDVVKKLQPQGRILIFGVPKEGSLLQLDHYYLFRQEIEIIGSFTSIKDSYRAIDFIRNSYNEILNLISHEITKGDLVEVISENKKLHEPLKIMVTNVTKGVI